MATVELLVYSGRPNPHIVLDDAGQAELTRRLAALPVLDRAFEADDRLGYQGLRIAWPSSAAAREVHVSRGHVQVREGSERLRTLSDTRRDLERWLLAVLGTQLPASDRALVAAIVTELDETHAMADTHDPARLVGTWTKTTTAACADVYPATVAFAPGTYRGTRGPAQGMVWWDAGIYRLDDAHTLVVGTATDELVSYRITVDADRFEVVDSSGCHVTYQRAARTP